VKKKADALDELGLTFGEAMAMTQLLDEPRLSRVKPATLERREKFYAIVAAMHPMSVRQVFYQATVRGIVPKDESLGYKVVVADLCRMRESGELPYEWLEDRGRWMRKPLTFTSVADALEDAARHYRKDLWADADCRVQIWLEKDALAAVVEPVTDKYDVPLMVSRGYASKSFLNDAAKYIANCDAPTFLYHLGDYDPSGVNAGEKIEETIRQLAPDADVEFERVAVTTDQIADWNLPTRPVKAGDTRAQRFGSDECVELDAIDPNNLRNIVEEAILRHLPPRRYEALMKQEASERNNIARLVHAMQGKKKPRGL
jgi:hypothetical protein